MIGRSRLNPLNYFKGKDVFIGFSSKAQGESHKEKNSPCQDSSSFSISKNKKSGIAIVADGHGGEKYFRSAKGSSFAIEISKQAIELFELQLQIRTNNNITPNLKQLASNIIYQWRSFVLDDIQNFPFNEEEQTICSDNNIDINNDDDLVSIYGTTLIAAYVNEVCWFALKIGDGTCVSILKNGKTENLIPEDERLGFGKTTSLCNTDAIDSFRYIFKNEIIAGVTVATDGVSDSFIPEKYYEFNINLLEDFLESESAQGRLDIFLPELSQRGSRDDVAIAGIYNQEIGRKLLLRRRKEKEFSLIKENRERDNYILGIKKYGYFISKK